jgi:Spy/CpxP family protein refolding chaperone
MFIGIFIGTVCLFALIGTLRRRRWYRHGGYGFYGGSHGGCGPYGGYYGGGRHGRGGLLWSVLARMETTPGQEKAIREALDELRDSARELRGTLKETRGDVARSVRGPVFDEASIGGAANRIDTAAQTLRAATARALAKIHQVLDDRQRAILGDVLESGWGHC